MRICQLFLPYFIFVRLGVYNFQMVTIVNQCKSKTAFMTFTTHATLLRQPQLMFANVLNQSLHLGAFSVSFPAILKSRPIYWNSRIEEKFLPFLVRFQIPALIKLHVKTTTSHLELKINHVIYRFHATWQQVSLKVRNVNQAHGSTSCIRQYKQNLLDIWQQRLGERDLGFCHNKPPTKFTAVMMFS